MVLSTFHFCAPPSCFLSKPYYWSMIWFIANSWYLSSHILWRYKQWITKNQIIVAMEWKQRTRPLWTCCHKVINRAIQYHDLQVFLFNDTLFKMYDWLIDIKLTTNNTGLMPEWNFTIFISTEGHHSLPYAQEY